VADLVVDDVAEQLPGLAVELHQLHLFDRKVIIRASALMPGSIMSVEISPRLAACFMTFARVRSSPHCYTSSPSTSLCARSIALGGLQASS